MIVLALLFLKAASAQIGACDKKDGPTFKFESEVIDYGNIEHNGNGYREFKFKNIGKEPLIISNAATGCGCLVATFPKEPINPGASGTIKVHYATDRVGHFEKHITVTSNDMGRPSLVLKIKGVVLPEEIKSDSTSTK